MQPRYITKIDQVPTIPHELLSQLSPITNQYVFRTNDYYLQLIDWSNPDDPIKKLIIPSVSELDEYGQLDASDEYSNYVAPGCQHKYVSTAVLLVSNVCGGYCRFCFRKRLFRTSNEQETSLDISQGIDYISNHPEINNVLLTGGDSLMLSTHRIEEILSQLREIPHVKIIRMGSKLPAFTPQRIYEDDRLLRVMNRYSRPDSRIYLMTHFNHPRELTREAYTATQALQEAGVITANQTPLLRGVNDNPMVLGELLNKLSYAGITPYYIFQNRPVAGNAGFVVPLREAYEIVEEAKLLTSGLAKRVRFVMSHATGKIEVVMVDHEKIYLKYHQAKNTMDLGRFIVADLPPEAAWFDDLSIPQPILH